MAIWKDADLRIIIIISIQPEGRFWQEPEPSQALAHCILGTRDLYQPKTELLARNGQSVLPVISTST